MHMHTVHYKYSYIRGLFEKALFLKNHMGAAGGFGLWPNYWDFITNNFSFQKLSPLTRSFITQGRH